MAPPPPPPPPPPICFPFLNNKKKVKRITTLAHSEKGISHSSLPTSFSSSQNHTVATHHFQSSTTLNSKSSSRPGISEDSENYEVSSRWGAAREKDVSPEVITRRDSSGSSNVDSRHSSDRGNLSRHSSSKSNSKQNRPGIHGNDSSSTLVGSALERKINDVESVREKVDTSPRLEDLRMEMAKENLSYYIVPSEDAHGSEYVAPPDRRREWISGFNGTAGVAVISKHEAYLITDSRYWVQARNQIDSNWECIQAGRPGGPKDWIDWLISLKKTKDTKIGVDARMLSHSKANDLNNRLSDQGCKLSYPPQNLIDLIWKNRPLRSKEPIFVHPMEFTGRSTVDKLSEIRDWVQSIPPSNPSYSKSPPKADKYHVATLITALDAIAYLLNLRGQDIPFSPVFHSYLMITLDKAILFVDHGKLTDDVEGYLKAVGVETREFNDIWDYLKKREWGEGKVIITPETSHTVYLMLSSFRCAVETSYVSSMMAVKNDTEIDGMRRAFLRDGASFVRCLAWLEEKLASGFQITEYEAAFRLTEYRRGNRHFMGLAYENISASGPNAALPHYSPTKSTAAAIERDTPYLNDSGGQYKDGTCDTTRTWVFGRPDRELCEAYTRVLQGHIAIDSAIFPEGTSGHQLDVLARRSLWKEGMDYGHGTGHGIGSYLNVHEGPHSFSSNVTLLPGHVITNEPGYYIPGKWGVRIESALVVRRVKPKHDTGTGPWLGFERLTCVPIQTKPIQDGILTSDEKQWIKDHNRLCFQKLEPYIRDDKRAVRWLKRETSRALGIAPSGPGGISIDW